MLLGDLNVDLLKFDQPDANMVKFVDKLKNEIMTIGFHQRILGHTRTWPGHTDSLLDHIWMNNLDKEIFCQNINRAASDHNLTIISVRARACLTDRHDIVGRVRKNFDIKEYRSQVENIDWSRLLESTDIDVINDIFVSEILKILDEKAPMKNFQKRTNFKNWISEDLKNDMKKRDILRDIARQSRLDEDWQAYRISRNRCVKLSKNCKKEYYNSLFDKMKSENNVKGVYKLTNELFDDRLGTTPQQILLNDINIKKTSGDCECHD